jgi:hypothetical protein
MVHTYNPSTQVAEARGSQVQGQPELHRESLFQQKNKTQQKTIKRIYWLKCLYPPEVAMALAWFDQISDSYFEGCSAFWVLALLSSWLPSISKLIGRVPVIRSIT